MTATRQAAEHEPIARVLPMLSVPHLDRDFDYLVATDQSDDAQPGVRVRVRFHGRLVDAFILERRSETDHPGKLGWLDRVVSAEPVLTSDVRRLVDAVAARYAGTRPDVLRLAVPPRHANVEKQAVPDPPPPTATPVDATAWSSYARGEQFLDALAQGRAARAVWQALPGESWTDRLAEAASVVVNSGRAALIIVPDQRDVDAVHAAALRHVDEARVVALSAGLGPAARYRRWLAVLRGHARLVVGTRSAVFAPVVDLGLVVVWDDGDDSLAEPRAPYPHAREVAMLRAHQLRCAALIAGYARTAEAQALVRSTWAHDLVADPAGDPSANAAGRRDRGQQLRPGTRPRRAHGALAVHGPQCGAGRASGRASRAGAGAAARVRARAGLRQVPHHRSLQTLHGTDVAARPRHRGRGVPVVRPARTHAPMCALRFGCGACGRRRRAAHRRRTRAGVSGHQRHHVRRRRRDPSVSDAPALVVATPGAEPVARGRLRRGAAPRRVGAPRATGPACLGGRHA